MLLSDTEIINTIKEIISTKFSTGIQEFKILTGDDIKLEGNSLNVIVVKKSI